MIDAQRDLLETIKRDREDESITGRTPVLCVKTAQAALTRACRIVDIKRMTHHDLRHLFATSCIEASVDIPTSAAGSATRTAAPSPCVRTATSVSNTPPSRHGK